MNEVCVGGRICKARMFEESLFSSLDMISTESMSEALGVREAVGGIKF